MQKIEKFFSKSPIQYLFVFGLFFTLFFLIQYNISYFLGSDAYYHAIHSKLTFLSNKFHYTEPWIKLHFFSNSPIDPYFIFHWFGGFFIFLFGKIIGFKIFISLLSSSIGLIFFFILKKNKVKYPLIWTIVFLLTSAFFFFRLLLPRSFIFSITLLIISYYLIDRKKYFLLYILSILYTLYYSFFIFLIILSFSYLISSIIHKYKIDIKPLITTTLGVITGLLLHPSTLNYIKYLYHQTIEVFFLKIKLKHFPTGEEISNHESIFNFFLTNAIPLLAFLLSLVLAWYLIKESSFKYKRKITPLVIYCSFWLLLILLIPRSAEYFIPFVWITLAITYKYIKKQNLDLSQIKTFYNKKIKYFINAAIVSTLLIVVTINIFKLGKSINNHNKNISKELKSYKNISVYLKKNTEKNSTIFLSNWSFFPKLFYYNQHNQYLTGFSPLFAYNYNKNKYWTWYNLSNFGYYCTKKPHCLKQNMKKDNQKTKQAFVQSLNTPYIIIDNEEGLLSKKLKLQNSNYKKLIKNKKFTLYKVK